jgi:hypothetical protein
MGSLCVLHAEATQALQVDAQQFAPCFSQALCGIDVLHLRAFVSAAQQDDDRASSLLEVDAVSMAMVNTQFADSLPYEFHIARKTKGPKARRTKY